MAYLALRDKMPDSAIVERHANTAANKEMFACLKAVSFDEDKLFA